MAAPVEFLQAEARRPGQVRFVSRRLSVREHMIVSRPDTRAARREKWPARAGDSASVHDLERQGDDDRNRDARSAPQRVPQLAGSCKLPLCDTKWLDLGHFVLNRLGGVPEIDCPLCVEPELRRVPKQPRQAESHLRTHRAPSPQQLVCTARGR